MTAPTLKANVMIPSRILRPALASLVLLATTAGGAAAQSNVLLRLRAGTPVGDRFRADSSGAFLAFGAVKDGPVDGCAAQIPATGAGTRFMWFPCLGSMRFGRVPTGQTNWDNASMNFFTFAGGNQVTASGYGSFAFGDQVTASATVGTGFGSAVTVSGTAGFSAGASNVCSGFACTAIGYTVRAGGQGSVALGYRTTANNDYAVAIGYRASNNTHTGTMVMGDESTTDSVRNQADNEFRARYVGGFRLRVSSAANGLVPGTGGNVGCDLTAAVPTWTCASSRTLKTDYLSVDGEDVLSRIHDLPITTWTMIGGDHSVRHIGPVAEDFHRAFGMGLGPTTIGMGDIDGVNIAAAKALELRTTHLQAQLDERTAQVDALQGMLAEALRRIEELDARVKAVEQK